MPTTGEPKIVERSAEPFAGIELEVKQSEIAMKAPPLIGEIMDWLKARGIAPAGAPFFNYTAFRPNSMLMQVGVPVAEPIASDGKVIGGTLPGGRYASVTNVGPYNELMKVNMDLGTWAKEHGHALDGSATGDEFRDANRVEIYLSDPEEDPFGQPVTEVAFRLAD